MNENKKETLRNLGAVVLTTGLTMATQGSSGLVLGVLNGIAGNLASSFIERSSYSKIKHLIKDPDPNDLNHDVQKLIVKAVEWTIRNIEILYKEELNDSTQKKELEEFSTNLIKEIKVLNDYLRDEGAIPIYKKIESSNDQDSILQVFDLQTQRFPTINEEQPYPDFFKEHFQPNLQLCFGELLKKEKNRPALIAYQREVYQSLDQGINTIISQNDQILSKLENQQQLVNENQTLKQVKEVISKTSTAQVDAYFVKSLDDQLSELNIQNAEIIQQNQEILQSVEQVKDLSKGISKELKTSWVEKNIVLVVGLLSIATVVIGGLVYKINTAPFDMTINVKADQSLIIHPDYPKLGDESRLRVYLNNEAKEKELTFANEIILNQLQADVVGQEVKAELLDPYWQLNEESIVLTKDNVTIKIRPNKALSKVSGRVLDRNGQTRIIAATIFVDNIKALTNAQGRFEIEVPMSFRKPSYLIRVEKEGYLTDEKTYFPGSDIEFRLSK